MKNTNTALNDWSCCESEELRYEFESFLMAVTVARYSLERDEHDEYKQAAVFYMWTGFCIAQKTTNQRGFENGEY